MSCFREIIFIYLTRLPWSMGPCGQALSAHAADFSLLPLQSFPPLQALVFLFLPVPHVSEQDPQLLQSPHEEAAKREQ